MPRMGWGHTTVLTPRPGDSTVPLSGTHTLCSGEFTLERHGSAEYQAEPRETPLVCSPELSVLPKWASASAIPVAQCSCEPMLHAQFFSSGTGAVTNQSIDRIYLRKVSASRI